MLLLSLLSMPVGVFAQKGKNSNGNMLICAISNFFECDVDTGCVPRTASELNAPQFLKIDIGKKAITPVGVAPSDRHVSKIVSMAEIDGMIILQGMEDGDAKRKDGVGWSISMVEDTGEMTITASGRGAGFVGLGACSTY